MYSNTALEATRKSCCIWVFGTISSRDITFLVFNMALAAILDLKVKIVPKHNDYYFIRSVMPKLELVGNGTSYAPLANLVQEMMFMVLAVIWKTKWGAIRILYRHFREVHRGLLFFKKVYFVKSIKKPRFRKMVTGPMTLLWCN